MKFIKKDFHRFLQKKPRSSYLNNGPVQYLLKTRIFSLLQGNKPRTPNYENREVRYL